MDAGLHNVLWIGGSFSGGKSTVARIISERFRLPLYNYDRHLLADPEFEKHKIRDGLWFWLPVEEKIDRYRSAFPIAIGQIAHEPSSGPFLVEGPGLLPELIAPLEVETDKAVFLIPTPSFQRWANRERSVQRGGWVERTLEPFEDKQDAWERWMKRDDEFAEFIERSAKTHGFKSIRNDGSQDAESLAQTVAYHFDLPLDGPGAAT